MRIIIALLTFLAISGASKDDLDFDIEDEPEKPGGVFGTSPGGKQQVLQESLLRAMQKPAVKEQIGQVIPILRVMSPQQRLTLAALVSAQIMSPEKSGQQSLAEVAQMFSGPGQTPKNVSEQLLLPISMDIAKMFKNMAGEAGRSRKFTSPTPGWGVTQPLPSSPMPFRPSTYFRANSTEKTFTTTKYSASMKGRNEINRRNGLDDVDYDTPPNSKDCDFLTSDICQEVSHYPEAEIMGSIQKHLTLMEPFLTEHGDLKIEERVTPRAQRRQDDEFDVNVLGEGEGYMCPSELKYAKPKRARTTSGEWKYIVNTGEYNQTLRLEICTKESASCSFLNDQFRSKCQQVYNYHRLMCWDDRRGLHMDVFKVPSCCSCHIQGYSTKYPPEFTFAEKRREVIPQSSSGVKREIPRPYPFADRPDPGFFEEERPHRPMEFPEEELSESQNYHQRVPARPMVFKEPSGPPRQSMHNKPMYNQRPPYSVDQNQEGSQRFPDRQNGMNRPHFERPGDHPTAHLVPPGPPLPLDFDRPRPSFDQRRKNETFNRGPEYNVVMEPMHGNKRGTQKLEQTLTKPQSPPRGKRPPVVKPVNEASAAPSDIRPQFKPSAEGGFGSKIRGRPSNPQKPVFVTPSTVPSDREGYEQSVRVTPKPNYKVPPVKLPPSKPPKKNVQKGPPQKKVNYNYHPIIDFFTRDAGQPQFASSPGHRVAPVQFNRRQQVDPVPVQQYADPQIHNQHVNGQQVEEVGYVQVKKDYSSPPARPVIRDDHYQPHREFPPKRHHSNYDGPSGEGDRVRFPAEQPNRREEIFSPSEPEEERQYSVPHVQPYQPGAHEWTPI